MQLTYPGARISTLQEVFDFVGCADPAHQVLWNIESKIDARHPNRTRGVGDFVRLQHEIFAKSPYKDAITVRKFSAGRLRHSFDIPCRSTRVSIGGRSWP